VSEQDNIQDLLRKGTEAAREGNRAQAREYFEKVVELDENNEKGWFFLSKVVETDEERRICLANVLHINPNNEAAQKAMDKLETTERKKLADEEVIPGITRRQLTLAVGGGVVLIVLVIALFLIISINNSQRAAAEAQAATAVALQIIAATDLVSTQNAAGTATQIAQVGTDTPTPRPTVELPPTFTPVPLPTALVTPTSLPCPQGVEGNIVASSGRDVLSNDFLPIKVFPLANCGNGTIVGDPSGNDLGRNPRFSPSGQRVIYTAYFATTFDYGIFAVNVNGTEREDISELWRSVPVADCGNFLRPEMPSYSPDESKIAFLAIPAGVPSADFQSTGEPATAVYLLNLSVPPDVCPVTRLTNDAATYRYPSLSPDGTRVAVVRNDVNSPNPGADIVIIDVNSLSQIPITNDLSTFSETSPRWTPDGLQLLYAAADRNNPGNNDIILINADGSGTPIPILEVRSDFDENFPVPSPDGNYLAFASNRSGFYDIYIFDRANATLWQLTNSEDEDYPGDWWRP
jgi:type II secretory pathway pseudopilin PulG